MSESPESDRLAGTPHPRETLGLSGHHAAEAALLDAYRSGRIHHGWIIGGPEGIGKATLAYRMARFVLAHPDPAAVEQAASLHVDRAHPVARQVASQSHVDLTVLRRTLNEKGTGFRANISVEDVRSATRFFASTSGAEGWRIAIVDSADDLAKAGANALLKVLEEPPARCLFLIVAHRPGRLLPTIRSRCRKIILSPLSVADTLAAASEARPDLARASLEASAAIAQGSVRRAITLAEGEGISLHQALMRLLEGLPRLDLAAAHALADQCAGKRGEENFTLLLSFLQDWLHARLDAERDAPPHRLARWAQVWEKADRAAREVEIYNLDRRPFILSTLSMIAEMSRGSRQAAPG
jgi:DNA polymerase-3 subunit delta'